MFLRTLAVVTAISLMIGCGSEDDTTPTTGEAETEQVQTDATPAVNSDAENVVPEAASDAETSETSETSDCSESDASSSDASVESGC